MRVFWPLDLASRCLSGLFTYFCLPQPTSKRESVGNPYAFLAEFGRLPARTKLFHIRNMFIIKTLLECISAVSNVGPQIANNRQVEQKATITKRKTKQMKNKILKYLVAGGALALAGLSASANSITVNETSGGGGTWVYDIHFDNSTVNSGDFFTINDFGSVISQSSTLPAGWSFSQGFTGPNSLPAIDNPGVLNVTFTWTGATTPMTAPLGVADFTLTLTSPLLGVGGISDYTSIDHVNGGPLAGQSSRVIGPIQTPAGPTIPDGGTTVMLLGAALSGLGLIRRKLA